MNERKMSHRVKTYPALPMCPRCKSLDVKPILYGRASLKRSLGGASGGTAAGVTVYFCNNCNLSW